MLVPLSQGMEVLYSNIVEWIVSVPISFPDEVRCPFALESVHVQGQWV